MKKLSNIQKTALICAAISLVFAVVSFFILDKYVSFAFFLLCIVFLAYLAFSGFHSADTEMYGRIDDIRSKWREESESLKKRIAENEDTISSLTEQNNSLREANSHFDEEIKRIEEEAEKRRAGMISPDELNYISILPKLPDTENVPSINLISVAKGVAHELKREADKTGLTINVSSSEAEIPYKADRELIRVLFRNIVDNSIKYMNRQGLLVITISTIGDDVFIIFKDTGEGLADTETDHIFELNFQGSNRISGNGLGLYQAKAIVNYYGGTIYAKSHFGGGMGIYIQLPIPPEEEN